MDALLRAILDDDSATVHDQLTADSSLVDARVSEPRFYDQKIFQWLYVGDTALHLAAAGYRVGIVKLLLAAGSDPNASLNNRHSGPFHYAADGYIIGPAWSSASWRGPHRCPVLRKENKFSSQSTICLETAHWPAGVWLAAAITANSIHRPGVSAARPR
jgi:hypothetical protein